MSGQNLRKETPPVPATDVHHRTLAVPTATPEGRPVRRHATPPGRAMHPGHRHAVHLGQPELRTAAAVCPLVPWPPSGIRSTSLGGTFIFCLIQLCIKSSPMIHIIFN